jgi:hypothetical protein
MRLPPRTASVFAVALSFAAAAHADQFDLTYTFGGVTGGGIYHSEAGTTINLTFDGTLNGNLITVTSDWTLTVDNNVLIALGTGSSDAAGGGPSVISLNGTQNNFQFNSTYAGADNYFTEFYSFTGSAAVTYDGGTDVISAYEQRQTPPSNLVNAVDESFGGDPLNASYTITDLTAPLPPSSVPDTGATVAMLGVAVASLTVLRRQFVLPTGPRYAPPFPYSLYLRGGLELSRRPCRRVRL